MRVVPYRVTLAVLCIALTGICTSACKEPGFQVLSARVVNYYDQVELTAPALTVPERVLERVTAEHTARPSEERPPRLLIRVEFRSPTSLWKVAQKGGRATVFLHAYFCAHEKNFAYLAWPSVYWRGQRVLIGASQTGNPAPEPYPGDDVYYFYFDVSGRESLSSIPPEHAFDLRKTPEDVCFYVTGWLPFPRGTFYKSQVAYVPKALIAAAFRHTEGADVIN